MNIYEPNISAGRRTIVIRIITRINNGRQLHANNAETNVGSALRNIRRRGGEFVSIDSSNATYNIARGAGKSALSMDAGGLKRIRDSINRARARFDLANCQEAAPTQPRASVRECGTLSRPALILVIKSEPYRRRNDDAVLPGIFRS